MNIIEFAEKYGVYVDPTNGWKYGLKLQEYEVHFLHELIEQRFTLNLASRQMHITTLTSIYAAHSLIFGEDESIVTMGPNMDYNHNFINKVRIIVLNYNPNTKFVRDNKRELQLFNGNRIKGVAAHDGLRGYGIDTILIDNPIYINQFEKIFPAIISGVSVRKDSKIHMFSQTNGLDFFSKLYTENDNGFKKNKYHYSLNSYYTEDKIKELKTSLSENAWRQEMELEFISVNEPKERILQVRIDEDTYNNISKRLMELDLSMSEYLRKLISNDLQHLK
jgi:hypothetical protein